MTEPSKYIKQPVASNLMLYVDNELKKIELSIQSLVAFALEEFDMSIIETGFFTPIIAGGTTAGAGTYSLQSGYYYKFGRFVIVQYRVTTTAHTGTGRAGISNLPFTVYNSSAAGFFAGAIWSSIQAVETALANPGTKRVDFYGPNPAGAMNIVNAMDFLGSMSYVTE